MEIRNPAYRERAAEIFTRANFVVDLGIEPVSIGPGAVESRLAVLERHLQQDGVIHAGVQTTLADHTAGAAAFTVIGPEQMVLTTGFTINLLATARGEELRARAQVLRAGGRLIVSESCVFAVEGGRESLVSKATVTLAVLPNR
ncbi:hypothetical protein DESUT3_19890 [Desulfuromonas versatilis]|uniref:Medium/long-chain acyl-CoA thioesterase YigI n=1 Tax=Desulfuromonas versatilis TaxID=2802975 RepID=A0ABN6DXY7_9BACT|nr:PaaI family thioesterase [Desulfuromonas versatilis]BCR04920.1 hypothetical protein DESUT3_19890 [Desulfuromonas versatilis]